MDKNQYAATAMASGTATAIAGGQNQYAATAMASGTATVIAGRTKSECCHGDG